jgi:hypothetical protein
VISYKCSEYKSVWLKFALSLVLLFLCLFLVTHFRMGSGIVT